MQADPSITPEKKRKISAALRLRYSPQNLKAEFGDIYTNLEVTDITHIFDNQLEIIPGREEQENGKKK